MPNEEQKAKNLNNFMQSLMSNSLCGSISKEISKEFSTTSSNGTEQKVLRTAIPLPYLPVDKQHIKD